MTDSREGFPNHLYRNKHEGTFSEVAAMAGLANVNTDEKGVSMDCVWAEYDNDGWPYRYVANITTAEYLQEGNKLWHNNGLGPDGHITFTDIALETGNTRDALGARVTVVTAASRQMRENNGGKCCAGQSDPRLHFGLGPEDRVKLLEVRWPDGRLQHVENVRADQLLTVRQDPAQYASQLALQQPAAKAWQKPKPSSECAAPKLAPGELEKLLTEMEAALRGSFGGYLLASSWWRRNPL